MISNVILGLDIGSKSVGTAISPLDRPCPVPLKALSRRGGEAEREILRLILEREIRIVVAGLPLSESRRETQECSTIKAFCRRLKHRCSAEFVFVDEHLSTFEAGARLAESNLSQPEFKPSGALDCAAAVVVLENYFQNRLKTAKKC